MLWPESGPPLREELVALARVGPSSTRGGGLFKLIRSELLSRSSDFLLIKHELLAWSSDFLLIKHELLAWSSVVSHQNKPTPREELAIFSSEVSTPRVEEVVFHRRDPNSTRGVRDLSRIKT